MTKKWVVLALLAVCLVGVKQAEAVILIEGFEAGFPPGSVLLGVGGTSAAVPNLAPTEGAAFGFIDTRGLTPIPGGTAGTTLLLPPFTLGALDVLSVDLNFLTNDGGFFADFAGVGLLASPGLDEVATLYTANTTGPGAQAVPCLGCPVDPISPGVTLTPATAFFDGTLTGAVGGVTYGPGKFGGGPGGSTGWVTASFRPGAGSYHLVFVVSDFGDTAVASGLAFDNIRSEPIPEPSSLALMGLGMAGLGLGRRRKRRFR